jgi:hypothetical protein
MGKRNQRFLNYNRALRATCKAGLKFTIQTIQTLERSNNMHNQLTHNGSDGRTYGGDPSLVHIPDHHRRTVGALLAGHLDHYMRERSEQIPAAPENAPLCPGCYMIALIDCAIHLAKVNGQDVRELGKTMAEAFANIAANGDYDSSLIEEIHVIPGDA